MKRLFKYANSFWVKYSDYVINETADGKLINLKALLWMRLMLVAFV